MTLVDVAIILALPIQGIEVTGSTSSGNWQLTVTNYLGVKPTEAPAGQRLTKTSRFPLQLLRTTFNHCSQDADDLTVDRYCMVYVLYYFCSVLFPDSGGDMASWMWLPLLGDWIEAGQYSWGSAALAWLYK